MKFKAGGLQIHKVNKWYPGNVHAVINMDMEIEQGEFWLFSWGLPAVERLHCFV